MRLVRVQLEKDDEAHGEVNGKQLDISAGCRTHTPSEGCFDAAPTMRG